MKTVKKVRVNTKLVKRSFLRLDGADKFGVLFGVLFLLPCVSAVMIDVIQNGSGMW
jgi:hypothetical protein